MKPINKLLEETDVVSELLSKANLEGIEVRTIDGPIDGEKRKKFIEKIQSLIESSGQGKCTLLVRGESRKKLKKKLNSNNPEFELLFQIGDKAKNYIKDKVNPSHPIKDIHSANNEVAEWIFNKYSAIDNGPFDPSYFTEKNKDIFIQQVGKDQDLVDYYLYGLQSKDSELLVNFVSSSTKPDVALHAGTEDKIVIVFWISTKMESMCINRSKIGNLKKKISDKELPVLEDSFYPEEDEYAIKGAIFPHFILCALDLKNDCIVVNPWLFKEKSNWLEDGLPVDQKNFLEFAGTTNYDKVIYLWSDRTIKNGNVS